MTDPAAAPSLALARDLRRALKRREQTLAPAIEAYDFATDGRARIRAAAQLMLTLERAEGEFRAAYQAAVERCERAEA